MEIVCRNDTQIDDDALCQMHTELTTEQKRVGYAGTVQQWKRGKYVLKQIERVMLQDAPVTHRQIMSLRYLMCDYYFDRDGRIRKLMEAEAAQ